MRNHREPSFAALEDSLPEVLAGPGPGHVLAPHQLQVGLGAGAGAARACRLRHDVPKQSQISLRDSVYPPPGDNLVILELQNLSK